MTLLFLTNNLLSTSVSTGCSRRVKGPAWYIRHECFSTSFQSTPLKQKEKNLFLVLLPALIKCSIFSDVTKGSDASVTQKLFVPPWQSPRCRLFPKTLGTREKRPLCVFVGGSKQKIQKIIMSQGCCSQYGIEEPTELPLCIDENYI